MPATWRASIGFIPAAKSPLEGNTTGASAFIIFIELPLPPSGSGFEMVLMHKFQSNLPCEMSALFVGGVGMSAKPTP